MQTSIQFFLGRVQLDMVKHWKKNSALLKHLMTLHNPWFFACSPTQWDLKGPSDNSNILYDPSWSFFVRMTDANAIFDMPKIKNSLEMYRWTDKHKKKQQVLIDLYHIFIYMAHTFAIRIPYAFDILGNWSDGWLGTKAISHSHTFIGTSNSKRERASEQETAKIDVKYTLNSV